ncbi:MAG: hypothetical protein HY815_17145, partial [Candidatus Riflebacteria bacterium]|nr:hypothetical protein [Candidatus Riflebacteria bacterium]
DLERFTAGSEPGKVLYDPRLDPTTAGGATYSVHVAPARDYYLAGVP